MHELEEIMARCVPYRIVKVPMFADLDSSTA